LRTIGKKGEFPPCFLYRSGILPQNLSQSGAKRPRFVFKVFMEKFHIAVFTDMLERGVVAPSMAVCFDMTFAAVTFFD